MSFADEWPEAKDITCPPVLKRDVIIGNDVWIGYRAMILPGVTIGDGATIGAGAVVVRDVEEKAVAYGIPAKTHSLQTEKEIEKYIESIEGWR